MLTVIFLSQWRYQYHNFDELLSNKPARLVAVLTPEGYQAFPVKQKPHFSELYQVSKTEGCDNLIEYTLDLAQTSQIIENEIKMAGGAEQVRIICADEGNVSLAGFLREKYSIPGPSYEQVAPYRDKLQMKSILASSTIRVPRFVK